MPNECHDLGGEILLILLHLLMKMLWHHNDPPLIFVMIFGPFSTTPPRIVHGIHIFLPQQSLLHCHMKFKGIEKRLEEVISPVQDEARKGYLN